MVFGKKDHLVGIDIGSAFVKVAELKIAKKGRTLIKFGISKVPYGTIEDGRILDMESLAKVIQDLFKTHKIKEKKVAISTGGHSVVIKTISTAKTSDKELQKTIVSEAEQYIPYDVDDVNIDYQILGESEFSPDQMNVLLVAVKKDLVAEYMELVAKAGLKPSIIDVDTFALQNIYETLPDNDAEELVLLVDVGASKTSLNIVRDKDSLMMRDTVSGVNQMIEALGEKFDVAFEDAEQILLGSADPPADPAVVQEVCQEVSNGWTAEICEVVHSFQSSGTDTSLARVFLSGGGGFVDSLAIKLADELEVPVARLDPFAGLTLNPKQFPEDFLSKVQLQAPIALGLALRRVDDK